MASGWEPAGENGETSSKDDIAKEFRWDIIRDVMET
jgi:hypothetical protein